MCIKTLLPFPQVHHFEDMSEEGRATVGNTTDGLVDYITEQFPWLLLCVWMAARIRRSAANLMQFYTGFPMR